MSFRLPRILPEFIPFMPDILQSDATMADEDSGCEGYGREETLGAGSLGQNHTLGLKSIRDSGKRNRRTLQTYIIQLKGHVAI